MNKSMIVILDFGGKYNQIISRLVRNKGVYCEIKACDTPIDKLKDLDIKGFVIPDKNIEEAQVLGAITSLKSLGLPMLNLTEEGEKELDVDVNLVLSSVLADEEHADLTRFIEETCKCEKNWNMKEFADSAIADIRAKVGDKKVLLALSGGVDSSVVAALISKAIGNQLTCVLVDHGLMRLHEADQVEKAFKDSFELNFIRIDAEDRFLGKLAGVTEPEQKRKIIGEEFIRVFEEEAKKIGKVDFLAQGTIYPDILESGIGKAKVIKSHHNVGGLPDHVDFEEILEPVKELFKDEVRELGRVLGLSDAFVSRQPFPGPGLGVRVIGELTKEKLDILRLADAIYREEIDNAGLNKSINQYFAILTGLKSVGIKNEARSYDYTLALRAVQTTDFMTAVWAKIPLDLLEKISTRITSEVDGINRIVYDITGKPPATIEWE